MTFDHNLAIDVWRFLYLSFNYVSFPFPTLNNANVGDEVQVIYPSFILGSINASQRQCHLLCFLENIIATRASNAVFSPFPMASPLSINCSSVLRVYMDQSNGTLFHWLLSATLQAILQPHANSSSKESLTGALRAAQQVPYGVCQTLLWYLCLNMSAHQASLPLLGTGDTATCVPLRWQCVSTIAGHFCCFHSIPPCLPRPADITCRHNSGPPGTVASAISLQELLEMNVQILSLMKWSVTALGGTNCPHPLMLHSGEGS